MKLNLFTRCSLAVALLAPQMLLASPGHAAFPRRGYIIHSPKPGRISADIGRRSSIDAGNRAALRMLSRLIQRYPRLINYRIDYKIIGSNGQEQVVNLHYLDMVEEPQILQGRKPTKSSDDFLHYAGVSRNDIHRVARRRGPLSDLRKYGALDVQNPLEVDIGTRSSVEAGNRAALRTLARLLSRPFRDNCSIRWNVILPNKQKVHMHLDYFSIGESININSFPDLPTYGATPALYSSASKNAIIRTARRSGTFRDLLKRGARQLY